MGGGWGGRWVGGGGVGGWGVGGEVGGWVGGVTKRKPKQRETDKSCRL